MLYPIIAALLLGVSKAGLKGPGVVIVGLVAIEYGSKPSTGILLPLLIIADLLAVSYYKRHVQWEHLRKFLPMMIIGVVIGAYIGKEVPEAQFKFWMAWIIIFGLIVMLIKDFKWRSHVPKHPLFANTMGLAAGFTTMVGNLAGPFANLYFMAQNINKNTFIGTAAWLFFIINLFKLPFHIFMWQTIDTYTLAIDLRLIVFVIAGFYIGIKIVKLINENWYRYIIYGSTGLGAAMILWS